MLALSRHVIRTVAQERKRAAGVAQLLLLLRKLARFACAPLAGVCDDAYNIAMSVVRAAPRRNMRAGSCSVCHATVAEMKGYLYGGPPWTVKCAPCSGVVAHQATCIAITLVGSLVTIRPSVHLGDKFDAFRKAIDGAQYAGNGISRLDI